MCVFDCIFSTVPYLKVQFIYSVNSSHETGPLKVGSWCFKGIILLIYFLNCRKALFQRNKQVSEKSIELKV